MLVSEWAPRGRRLVKGPRKGSMWTNEFAPYAVRAMDLFCDPWVRMIVLKWAPQTVKTSVALNMMMYAADYDPDDLLYIMPDEKVSKRISRRQIVPTLKASPIISRLLSPRHDAVTATHIELINGMDIDLAWASSAAELASESYRYLFGDETGKWPKLAGREGDPLELAMLRTNSYPDTKKIVLFSSPNEEDDAITRAEKECEQRLVYLAQCPVCDHRQQMRFRNYSWPEDTDRRAIKRLRLARYQCEDCGMDWDDAMRNRAVATGDWAPIAGEDIERPMAVALHLPAYYSPLVSLSDTAAAYLKGKEDYPTSTKIFRTQHKAQEWKDTIVKPEETKVLRARCDLSPQTVPPEAVALSCGIDVQKYSWWFLVRAWARDYTNWLVHYGQLTDREDVKSLLFEAAYPVADSDRTLRIWRCGMDTGGGKKYQDMSMTEETYWFIRELDRLRQARGGGCRVYACQGSSRTLPGRKVAARPTILDKTPSGKPMRGGLALHTIDTGKVKDMVVYRLAQAAAQGAYASYLHSGTGLDYARQISAEEKQRDRRGVDRWVQVRKDNHLLDCEGLAQIVVDPEWPGGGLNLLRNGSGGQRRPRGRRVYSTGVAA